MARRCVSAGFGVKVETIVLQIPYGMNTSGNASSVRLISEGLQTVDIEVKQKAREAEAVIVFFFRHQLVQMVATVGENSRTTPDVLMPVARCQSSSILQRIQKEVSF